MIWEVVGDVELDHDFHHWKENCKRSDERTFQVYLANIDQTHIGWMTSLSSKTTLTLFKFFVYSWFDRTS